MLNPPRLYFNYSESSVPTSLMLGLWDDASSAYLPTRDLFSIFKGYPQLRGVFQTHREFASSGVLKLVDYHRLRRSQSPPYCYSLWYS